MSSLTRQDARHGARPALPAGRQAGGRLEPGLLHQVAQRVGRVGQQGVRRAEGEQVGGGEAQQVGALLRQGGAARRRRPPGAIAANHASG